jgi:hypothetical protein
MAQEIDVKRDNTTKAPKYYAVIRNPNVRYYDTKFISGGSPDIVKRKAETQFKKWEQEAL